MPCDHVKLPYGGTAIVCSRERRKPRCSVKPCKNAMTKRCDFKDRTTGVMCDRPLCDDHAIHVKGKDLDYCCTHPEVIAALDRKKAPA